MPNWCENKAVVKFKSAKAADEFVKACAEERSGPVPGTLLDWHEPKNLFQYYLPMPADAEEQWYNWCVHNWGTKWAPDITAISKIGDKQVEIKFQTAWSPPLEWFETCGMRYNWHWQLGYIEPGIAFAGHASGDKNGILLHDRYWAGGPDYEAVAQDFGISLEDYDDSEPTT